MTNTKTAAHTSWLEIKLATIADNIRQLRGLSSKPLLFMAVVKANAYGHGLIRTGKTAIKAGANWLGVARIDEAIALRQHGIKKEILIFGRTPPERTRELIEFSLTQTVFNKNDAKVMSKTAKRYNSKIKIHIKIDTGMGRLGLDSNDLKNTCKDIGDICALSGLHAEGLFTHFASSDAPDNEFTYIQIFRFNQLIAKLKCNKINFNLYHAANSAAAIRHRESHFNMIRIGISMYGIYEKHWNQKLTLKPALSIKSKIIQLKRVNENSPIGYDGTHLTVAPTTVATVPLGYGDGYGRGLSNSGHMLVRGHRAQIIGRVCMDLTMLDVSHITDIDIEEEVVALGQQGKNEITSREIATKLNTIDYEIFAGLTSRLKKIYI